jgi:hypothetical protein
VEHKIWVYRNRWCFEDTKFLLKGRISLITLLYNMLTIFIVAYLKIAKSIDFKCFYNKQMISLGGDEFVKAWVNHSKMYTYIVASSFILGIITIYQYKVNKNFRILWRSPEKFQGTHVPSNKGQC